MSESVKVDNFDPLTQARADASPQRALYAEWVGDPAAVNAEAAASLVTYLESVPTSEPTPKTYEDMGMLELARALGDAERREDRGIATEVSRVLIDKIEDYAEKTKIDAEAQEALFDRLWRVKDGVDATTNKAKKVQAKAEKAAKVTSTVEWEPIAWPEVKDSNDAVKAPEKAETAAKAGSPDIATKAAEANADVSQAEVSPKDRVKQIEKELADMADNGASRDDFTAKLFEYRAAYRAAVPKDAGLKTLNAYLDNMNDNIKAMTSWFRDGASAPVANEAKAALPVEAPAESGVTPQKRMVELRREIKAHIANGDISPEDYAAKVNEYRESYLLSIPEGESDDSIKKFIKQLDDDTAKIYSLYQPQTAGEPVAEPAPAAAAPAETKVKEVIVDRDTLDRRLFSAKDTYDHTDNEAKRAEAVEAARKATLAIGRKEKWNEARIIKESNKFRKQFGGAELLGEVIVQPAAVEPQQVAAEVQPQTPEQEQEAAYQQDTSDLRVVIREEFRKEKQARALLGADLSKMNATELRAYNEKLEALGGDNALLQMEEQRDNFDQKIKDLTEALDIRVKARAAELGVDEEWIEKEQNTQAKLLAGEKQETDPAKTAVVPVVAEVAPAPKKREKKTRLARAALLVGTLALGAMYLFSRGESANSSSQVTTATTNAPEAAASAAPAPNESPKGLKPGQTIWDKATEQLRSQGISSPSEADIAHEMSHQMFDKSGNQISLKAATELPVGFENSRK